MMINHLRRLRELYQQGDREAAAVVISQAWADALFDEINAEIDASKQGVPSWLTASIKKLDSPLKNGDMVEGLEIIIISQECEPSLFDDLPLTHIQHDDGSLHIALYDTEKHEAISIKQVYSPEEQMPQAIRDGDFKALSESVYWIRQRLPDGSLTKAYMVSKLQTEEDYLPFDEV